MNTLNTTVAEYIEYCEYRKRLDFKTLKAYRIDLRQYESFCSNLTDCFSKTTVDKYITDFISSINPELLSVKLQALKPFFVTWNIRN